jgi:hypothetical protein
LNPRGEDVLRRDEGVQGLRGEEAADPSSRAPQQDDGQGELEDDEGRVSRVASPASGRPRLVLERRIEVDSGRTQRGTRPKPIPLAMEITAKYREGDVVEVELDPVRLPTS